MKRTLLSLLFVTLLPQVEAADPPYLASLKVTRERFGFLEAHRNDYRKPKPELPPTQEEERLRLLGQLLTDDPIWALQNQVQADIDALAVLRPRTPADDTILEALKDILAITGGFDERATTRTEAEKFATALRQFAARRDAVGASAWAKSQ